MISPRGAEVLSEFAVDLITTYGTKAAELSDDDLRGRLAGMTDPQVLGRRAPLFDHQLADAVKLLRRLFELAIIDVSWRPGAVEAVRAM